MDILDYVFFDPDSGLPSTASFAHSYVCLPPSAVNRPHLELGDKILLPVSALDRLAAIPDLDYPMLFSLHHPPTGRTSHCGVLEFVADEGEAVMPRWMMDNMGLQEGSLVVVRSACGIPKAKSVKLRPHSVAFLDVSNPKAMLERSLKGFSCLTKGDTIALGYNERIYMIDVLETMPDAAVSLFNTDCEVDFAAPLDHKETENPKQKEKDNAKVAEVDKGENKDVGRLVGGMTFREALMKKVNNTCVNKEDKCCSSSAKPGKLVFGTRVKGQFCSDSADPSGRKEDASDVTTPAGCQSFVGKARTLRGAVVIRERANESTEQEGEKKKKEGSKVTATKFRSFSGKGRTLMDEVENGESSGEWKEVSAKNNGNIKIKEEEDKKGCCSVSETGGNKKEGKPAFKAFTGKKYSLLD